MVPLSQRQPLPFDNLILLACCRHGFSDGQAAGHQPSNTGTPDPSLALPPLVRRSFAQVTGPPTNPTPSWFKPCNISLPPKPPLFIEDEPACLFSAVEIDATTKQYEHALII